MPARTPLTDSRLWRAREGGGGQVFIAFVKMDIQGYEYAALQGMKETLVRCCGTLKMLMELWPAGLKKAGASASATVELLEQCGYQVHLIEGKELRPLTALQTREYDNLGDEFYFNVFVR
jgi:hypothetical protein